MQVDIILYILVAKTIDWLLSTKLYCSYTCSTIAIAEQRCDRECVAFLTFGVRVLFTMTKHLRVQYNINIILLIFSYVNSLTGECIWL